MREKINIKTKGETNVESDSATILRKTNIVDVDKSDVMQSGKGDWCDFELMDESNRMKGDKEKSMDEASASEFSRRLKQSAVGRKILAMKSLRLEMA